MSLADGSSTCHTADREEVYDIPLSAIIRPFQPDLDEDKVCSLMQATEEGGDIPFPVDVLHVHVEESGNNYYFAFGGCHRFAASDRLGKDTIRAKLVKATPATIRAHMGAATPKLI